MKRILSLLLLLACPLVAAAQAPPLTIEAALASERREAMLRKEFFNQIEGSYSARMLLGKKASDSRYGDMNPLEALTLSYARYGYSNLGVRAGASLFLDNEGIRGYAALPVQLTYRSAKLWDVRFDRYSPDVRLHGNYDQMGDYSCEYDSDYSFGAMLADIFLTLLPKRFEVHAGLAPGFIFGPREAPFRGATGISHRFACTFDAGARLIIPVWRFELFLDVTYHLYLTDNFRREADGWRPSRSYMGVGGGLGYRFGRRR